MSKMEDKKYEVVVVSLGDYSLDILMKKKFYAFPRGSRKVGDLPIKVIKYLIHLQEVVAF